MEITDSTWMIYTPEPLFRAIRGIFLNALAFTDGDQKRAARYLRISPRVMTYSLAKYDIPSKQGAERTRAQARGKRRRTR